MTAADKNLNLLEAELMTIRRAAEASSDFEAADTIGRAAASALQSLFELRLDAQTETTEDETALAA